MGIFGEEDRGDPRGRGSSVDTTGPGGLRFGALLIASLLMGAVVAPIGAAMCAIIAFFSPRADQRTWRGAFIILTAVFIVLSALELYLLVPGKGEFGPPGGDGVQG